jgi:polyphosphate kinase
MPKIKTGEFINREISWLSFNERVLQEAADAKVPLIERMRFLGIFSNNMDEFYRVRVASLRRMSRLGQGFTTDLEFDPTKTLNEIRKKTLSLQVQYDQIFEEIEEELRAKNIQILDETQLSEAQKEFAATHFFNKIRSSLVPLMLDASTKALSLNDETLYLAVQLKMVKGKKEVIKYSIIEIPKHLARFVVLPPQEDQNFVMFLEDLIRLKLQRLFALFNAESLKAYAIKITRDAELDIDDDISKSLVEKMSKSIDKRKKGDYVRFLFDSEMPIEMFDFLAKKLKIKDEKSIMPGGRYHHRKDLMSFPDFGRADLNFVPKPPLEHPVLRTDPGILDKIIKQDILLHYPYQSFNYIVDMLREAAIDPDVRRIRINLYRVAKNSQVINALVNAAKNGKKVTVVVELQARFDEQNNISVSNVLQEAGAKVIFGVPGLKVHSKLVLITKKPKNGIRYVAHIGTGNLHEGTAGIYEDISLLTADIRITKEVHKLFAFFENNYERGTYRHLIVSPYSTRRKFLSLINKEIANAKKGEQAWISLKLNNLVDASLIRKLYDASIAGVKVRLIVRGVCALIPGVKGMSENISAVSIIGRYLEHARVISFCNGGKPRYFISSADWMARNLDHRIEVSVEIYEGELKKQLEDFFEMQFSDNVKARKLDKELSNSYVKAGQMLNKINAQEEMYQYFKRQLE